MAVISKLEFKQRKSGRNAGKIASHYHLSVYGVPWQFRAKVEHGRFYKLDVRRKPGEMEFWIEKVTASEGNRVCWQHNWDHCPIEVLELQQAIKNLDGSK